MLSELAYEKTESGQGIILTEYFGEGKSRIKLPEEIDGLPVVMLGEEIFMNHEALKEIILPENYSIKKPANWPGFWTWVLRFITV